MDNLEDNISRSVEIINLHIAKLKSPPKIAIILGSGLGQFSDLIKNPQIISSADLAGFPDTGVEGHAGKLILGKIEGKSVAVMQGRAHYYEHGDAAIMKTAIRTLNKIGCDEIILTNAAGSINKKATPGSIMMLTDHINFTGVSPLFGEKDISRFVNLIDAYDPEICQKLRAIARQQSLDLYEGVYMWFCGPNFETAAEIRAAKILGADVVGMSTVPEVIMARQLNMKVAAISIITNMAAGLSHEDLSHSHTMENAKKASDNIMALLTGYLGVIAQESVK